MTLLAGGVREEAAGRGRRRRERWLARQDRIGAQLAELHVIREVLDAAADVVSRGWLQGAWFRVPDGVGSQRSVTAYDIGLALDREVSAACLVGAVVTAGGGPRAVRTPLVQRSLDLTWHTLREDPQRPVHWCPSPSVRMAHVCDLTRWNDRPGRTAAEVGRLLTDAVGTTYAQVALLRAEQGAPR